MLANQVRLLAFGVLAALSPATTLLSQTDPSMMPPASQTQPNQPGRVQAPTTSLQDSSGAPSETIQQMKDKMFLRKATEGGLAEVQLGKLASTKAGSQEVKDFGQKMADEHAQLNDSMAAVADSMGIMLPKKMNKADQAQYEKLNALSGDAFDKEYLACMVKDHHGDLREFRTESATTADPDLKAAVDKGSRVIRDHMIMADKLAEQNGVPVPGHGNKQAAAPSPQ